MVSLNLTLLIQVALFLGFLRLMHGNVFAPAMEKMDFRVHRVRRNREIAQESNEEAARLERQYAHRVAALHRESTHQIQRAHREVQEAHANRVLELHRKEDQALLQARADAEAQLAEARAEAKALTQQLAARVEERLHLEVRRS